MIEAARLKVTVGADTSQAERGLQSFSQKMKSYAGTIGTTMALGISASAVAAGAAALNIGMDFESAFAGVRKTMDGTADEMAAIRQGILDMANVMPATAVEIAGVAEAAGALGIAKENVLGFTESMVMLGETTNMTAQGAADELARFANIMQMPQDQFDRLGSAIVALGNDGASTEAEIVAMAQRIAGAGAVVEMSEAQVLGWSSAMSSLGINAEAGGTAFTRVVVDMSKEVSTGGKKLKHFAQVAGVSVDSFAKMFEGDASAATLMFVEGLGKIDAAGGSVFQTLEDLGFADVRVQDTLLRLSGANDLVTDSLETANRAWAENTALAAEAEVRFATTRAKLAMLQNQLKGVGIGLFDTFKPAIEWSIDGMTNFAANVGNALLEVTTGLEQIRTTGTGAFDIGPISVDWTPEEKTVSLDTSFLDVVVGWTEELKTIDLHTSFLDVIVRWTEETKTIALDTSFLDVIVNWKAESKVIDVDGFFGKAIVNWSPLAKFVTLDTQFLDVFVDWFPKVKTVDVTTSFMNVLVSWGPEVKTVDLSTSFGDVKIKVTPELTDIEFTGQLKKIDDSMKQYQVDVAKNVLAIKGEALVFGAATQQYFADVAANFALLKSAIQPLIDMPVPIWITEFQAAIAAWAGRDRTPLEQTTDRGSEMWRNDWQVMDDAMKQYQADVAANVLAIAGEVTALDAALVAWQTGVTAGVTAFYAQVATVPEWIASLATAPAWLTTTPQWITNLLAWRIPMPDWLSKLPGMGGLEETTLTSIGTRGGGMLSDILREREMPIALDFTQAESAMATWIASQPPLEIPITPTVPTSDILRGSYDFVEQIKSQMKNIGGEIFESLELGGGVGGLGTTMLKVTPEVSGPLKQPAVPPTLQVRAEVIGGLAMPDTSGLEKAGSTISSTLSGFSWPKMPDWDWPVMPIFDWPQYDPWKWPPIAAPDWLNRLVVPRPSWLGEMLSWSPQVRLVTGGAPTVPGQLARGTDYWKGGYTWVGERGAELVNLPRGAKVYNHQKSREMAGGGGNVTVQITGPVYIREEADIQKLAYEVSRIQNRRG